MASSSTSGSSSSSSSSSKNVLSKAGKAIAFVVVLISVVIGLVGKYHPELFLTHVPRVGFILWALTGHYMPPHFDSVAWTKQNFHKWIQDGDIVQATMAKSGTIWLAQITYLLKHNGTDDYDNLHDEWGITEMQQYPGQTLEERMIKENKKRRANIPMSWFSHQFPSEKNYGLNATLHPNIKYIISARNPKEIIRSFVPFLNAHTDEFRQHWGGFPPIMDKKDALQMFALDNPDFLFRHIEGWWKLRHEPNVLFVHYTDLKQNSRHEIQRIASFLDIDLSNKEDLLDTIVYKSSFRYMKDNHHRILTYMGKENDRYLAIHEGKHVASGTHGDVTEDFFTPEMNNMWNQAVEKWWGNKVDPQMIQWVNEGGVYK